jgi:predicted dienelactone hydrolase
MASLSVTTHANAAPELPLPDGPHAVGMQRFELIDTSRRGVTGDAPTDARVVPVMVWYPARPGQATTRPYFNATEQATQARSMERNFKLDAGVLDGLTQVVAHSGEGVAPARAADTKAKAKFPLVFFNHGYEIYPSQNTALMERWASHGYIVVSIGHLHDAVDTQLADGRVVTTSKTPAGDPATSPLRKTVRGTSATFAERKAALSAYVAAEPRTRLGLSRAAWQDDNLFVARAIEATGTLPAALKAIVDQADTQRVAVTGMSFGGATAASVCPLLPNCRAAINLDGGNQEPGLFNAKLTRPFLLMQSDWTRTPGIDPAISPNDFDYERWTEIGNDPDVVRLRVDGMKHLGFTDLALLLRDKSPQITGTIAGPAAVEAIGRATLAFLDQYLRDGGRRALVSVVEKTPELHWHDPSKARALARSQAQASEP